MIKEVYEKVNIYHPDKIADRIAGAVVDLGYELSDFPKVAVEVMIGHGECYVMVELMELMHVDKQAYLQILMSLNEKI